MKNLIKQEEDEKIYSINTKNLNHIEIQHIITLSKIIYYLIFL